MKFEKTYLSRAMTKAMSADHPIGDPTGGPAYGERNDPVSAIIAVGSMTATYAAATTFAAMTLAQGLIFAGAALNLVGNVTGNKKLMVLGAVVGLAGAAGSLMSDPTTGFNAQMSEAFSSTPASSGSALSGSAAQSSVASKAAVAPGNLAKQTLDVNAASSAGPTAFSPNYDIASQASATSATPSGMGLTAPASAPNSLSLTGDVDPGTFKKFTDFASKEPMAAMIIANAGSEFAGGVMDTVSGKSGAEAKQLEANAAYATSVAAKTNREMALDDSRIAQLKKNLQALSPGQFNVNPNAVTLGPKPPGLIANARA